MSTRLSAKGERVASPGRRHDHQPEKADGKGHRMTLIQKLMLCAQMMGMEASINYEQIYSVPILQTLGMPVSLSYVSSVVSGPFALLILPLFGWFVDRGDNPLRRKFAAIVFAAVIQALGVLTLLTGNMLHLQYLLEFNATGDANLGSLNASVSSDVVDVRFSVGDFGKNVSSFGEDLNSFPINYSDDTTANTSASFEVYSAGSTSVSFKAGLGMLGIIFQDLGFDTSNSFIKTFLVTCAARAEQTSVIVVGVIVGAVGGLTNATLGLVDFTSLLGLSDIDGARLSIQTSVQGLLLLLINFFGLLSTSIIGFKQHHKLHEIQSETGSTKLDENGTGANSSKSHKNSRRANSSNRQENGTRSHNADGSPNTQRAPRKSLVDALEDSMRSFGESIMHAEHPVSQTTNTPSTLDEDIPLLENDILNTEYAERDRENSSSVGYGTVESDQRRDKTSAVNMLVEDGGGLESEKRGCLSCLRNPKVRIGFVCITTFFSVSGMVTYTFAMSDFVGKVIYGGDPNALPGSDSLTRYQEGIKTASWALLVYFITYLITSIIHPRVLAFLGFRMEFLMLQSLMALSILMVALTSRLEAVFVLSVVAGTHRTCLYTMPYAVANDIAQTIVTTGTDRSPVGLSISLVAASIPLASTLLYTWLGVIQQLTGDDAAPLWLGTGYCTVGVIAFLFVGKV